MPWKTRSKRCPVDRVWGRASRQRGTMAANAVLPCDRGLPPRGYYKQDVLGTFALNDLAMDRVNIHFPLHPQEGPIAQAVGGNA